MGKRSLGFIGKLFGVTTPAVLKWIRHQGAKIAEKAVAGEVREMEFDELGTLSGQKNQPREPQGGGSGTTANHGLGLGRP